ncbi:MAG TPA: hypothetical protein VIY47_08025 [Ignavibacteriaceae bacterium]
MLAKKKMEQKFDCKYCGKKFHKESTLATHMCVKKRRYLDINTEGFRFGFRTFQKFYTITTNIKKIKTQEEFIDSPYYIDFVKFGNHIALLKPVYIEQYIEFVIRSGLKIPKWSSDPVYELYIENLIKTEPSASAADRTISVIIEWCESNKVAFNQFFTNISANEAAYLIKTGRISPWVLYLCRSAEDLQSRFTEDHDPMIKNVIDPGFWMRKFKKADDDVEYIKNLLEQAGL